MLQLLPLAHLIVLLQSTFIPVAAQAVRLLQVSANKRYLAAAECPHSGSAQQQVSIYNVPAQKREQTLQLASHAKGSTITSMSFRCVCVCMCVCVDNSLRAAAGEARSITQL